VSEPLETLEAELRAAAETNVRRSYRRYGAWVGVVIAAWTVLVVFSVMAVTEREPWYVLPAAVAFASGGVAWWRGQRAGDRWHHAYLWRYGHEPGGP